MIAELLTQARLSTNAAARYLGVTPRTIRRYVQRIEILMAVPQTYSGTWFGTHACSATGRTYGRN